MVLNTSTKELEETTIGVVSLFSWDGLAYMLTKMVNNFTTFTSVGYTCTIMLAIGVAEQSGWMDGLIRKAVALTPAKLVTPLWFSSALRATSARTPATWYSCLWRL